MARAPFKLRSGNTSSFKNMGSSPFQKHNRAGDGKPIVHNPRSPAREKKGDKVVSSKVKQAKTDAANIKEHTNTTTDRETNKSIRRTNSTRVNELSRREVKKELKTRKKSGRNNSKKQDTSWLKRTFGGTKALKKDLKNQQYKSDQNKVEHVAEKYDQSGKIVPKSA